MEKSILFVESHAFLLPATATKKDAWLLENPSNMQASFPNYGHDDFSIGLLRDTTMHVEIQLMIYGAKHPFLWNRAHFFHLMRPMHAQKYIKLNLCNISPL